MTATIDGMVSTPTRLQTRINVGYREFVFDYARGLAGYAFLTFAGVGLIIGSGIRLDGALMVALVAAGLGLAAAGLGGLTAVMTAHGAYTQRFAATTTTTYQAPEPTPSVRAFVPSQNGTPTIRAGKFRLTRQQWTRLFQTAGDGGRLTRDGAQKVLPRELYRNWADTIAELARLGIVDDGGTITAGGWQWYQDNIGASPYPDVDDRHRAPDSTHARRTHDAHDAGMTP